MEFARIKTHEANENKSTINIQTKMNDNADSKQ